MSNNRLSNGDEENQKLAITDCQTVKRKAKMMQDRRRTGLNRHKHKIIAEDSDRWTGLIKAEEAEDQSSAMDSHKQWSVQPPRTGGVDTKALMLASVCINVSLSV